MATLQAELDTKEYTATAGGGAVTATVDGKHTVTKLDIDPEVVDPEDVEMLSDLIMAAVNEAVRKAADVSETEMAKITGGLNMPGMF
jgi:DNA-binding YbaB/EbfC family protein